MPKKIKLGFTLIELLVAVAIIGVLVTVVTIALASTRMKARDARRVSDIKQIQTALELFFSEKDRYPTAGEFVIGQPLATPDGSQTYMGKIPSNPQPREEGVCAAYGFDYIYSPIGNPASPTIYTICYCLAAGTAYALPGPSEGCQGVASLPEDVCISDCTSAGRCAGANDNCGNPCPTSPAVPAVANVRATPSGADYIIAWNAVANAEGYVVYRDTAPNASTQLMTPIAASYTDSGLLSNATYYYRVKAKVCDQLSPDFSNEVSVQVAECSVDADCGPCQRCMAGTCANQASGDDLKNDCPNINCADYIYGWNGNSCSVYAGATAQNGKCDGSGACAAVAASCAGAGAQSGSAGCGSSGCKGSCAADSPATGYDTLAEACYTSGQRSCPAGYSCSASASCQVCGADSDCNACEKCVGGDCVNQANSEDLKNDCPTITCTDYIYGWNGNSCNVYAGATAQNGKCNGSGACSSVTASCTGTGAQSGSAVCGSSGCKANCIAGALAASYDTLAEACYTSSQHGCNSGYSCSASASCQCSSDSACGFCQKCSDGTCVNQTNGEDLKNECGTTNCGTGNCDGSGSCSTSCVSPYVCGGSNKANVCGYQSGYWANTQNGAYCLGNTSITTITNWDNVCGFRIITETCKNCSGMALTGRTTRRSNCGDTNRLYYGYSFYCDQ